MTGRLLLALLYCQRYGSDTKTSRRVLFLSALYVNIPQTYFSFCTQATVRSALETGTLDLEGKGLTSLSQGLFQDGRTLSAVTRAKLSANKLQVGMVTSLHRWGSFWSGDVLLCVAYPSV